MTGAGAASWGLVSACWMGGAAGEVASPAGLAQQPRDLGHLQRAAPFGGGCGAQHGQGLRVSQVGAQRGQRRGIELPQGVAQPVEVALSSPDQPLVRPGEDLDRLGLVAVTGDEAVMMPVAADDLGQHPRIPRVRLGARGHVPLTVAAGLQRVDPIDLISGGGQRTHQQTAVGLDADDHRRRVLSVRGDQLVKPADSLDAIGHPAGGQNLPSSVHQAHIVVVLGPVNADEDHRGIRPPARCPSPEPEPGPRRANGAALDPWRLIPPAISTCPSTSRDTI